jgi:hypothetical protein
VVVVADRLVTVSITCWVENVAHEVIEQDVAAIKRRDDHESPAVP